MAVKTLSEFSTFPAFPYKYLQHNSKEHMANKEIENKTLSAGAAFMNTLTVRKVFLTVVLALSLAFAYGLYDQKSIAQQLANNPGVLIVLIGGTLLISLGLSFTSLQSRIDDKSKELQDELRQRLHDQHANHKETIANFEEQLILIQQSERTCKEQYHMLTLQLAKKGFFKDDTAV